LAHTEPAFRYTLGIDEAGGHRDVRKQISPLWNLAYAANQHRRHAEAEALARRGIARLAPGPIEQHGHLGNLQRLLAQILTDQQRFGEAEPELLAAYRQLLSSYGPDNLDTIIATYQLAELYAKWNRPRDADPFSHQMLTELLTNRAPGARGLQLNRMAWLVVRDPGCPRELHELALRAAEIGVGLEPANGVRVNTVGVAQYRLGRFDEAIATLERSEQLTEGTQISDFAFLAMSHARLGHRAEARTYLARVHESKDSLKPDDEQYRRIIAEAEAVVGGGDGGGK
jgi:tetratricopeptide (TPR) repeat protein